MTAPATFSAIDAKGATFSIVRSFQAPRELVWKAHSELEHLKHWWGPVAMKWIDGSLEFRPGGLFLYGMAAPNGTEMWGRFIYREIEPMDRIVFINSFSDRAGAIQRAPFNAKWPLETYNELAFTEKDGVTTVALSGYPITDSAEEVEIYTGMHASMRHGFGATYDHFADYLKTLG